MPVSDLPAPLVPADLDLRDFPFMPLDITRLFGSDFHAQSSDAEWRAGVTLWLRSYHQIPAGSLPDDEVALARLAELGRDVKSWRKIATGALRGWLKCSDQRLYHRTVSEKALEGWIEKLLQRKSSAAGNAKRYGHPFDPAPIDAAIQASLTLLAGLNPHSRVLMKRIGKAPAGTAGETPTGSTSGSPNGPPDDVPHHSQETGKGKDISSLRSDSRPKRVRARQDYPQEFLEFWAVYPTDPNMGKREALDEWLKLGDDERRLAIASCPAFVRHCKADPTYRPIHANRYLAKRRFEGHAEAQTVSRQAGQTVDLGGGLNWPEPTVLAAVSRWRTDPTTWPIDRIGPPPGQPDCRVPGRLLEAA